MKKLFAMLLTITLLIPSFAISSYAASGDAITEAEAKTLVFKAINLFYHIYWPEGDELINEENERITIDGVHYIQYNPSMLPGGSYEAMKEYVKTIYTDDLAPQMSERTRFSRPNDEGIYRPQFIVDEEGRLWGDKCITAPEYLFFSKSLYTTETKMDYWTKTTEDDLFGFELVSSDANNAVAKLKIVDGVDSDTPPYYWLECKLIKTENGWRITDSDFTEMISWWMIPLSSLEPAESPATADADYSMVIALSLTALAALMPAAAVIRKRKEEYEA